jgi:hypothetical protein
MAAPRFEGGSPVSETSNPYSGGDAEQRRILDPLPSDEHTDAVLREVSDLWGAAPPTTDDAAAARPLNPPTTANNS